MKAYKYISPIVTAAILLNKAIECTAGLELRKAAVVRTLVLELRSIPGIREKH